MPGIRSPVELEANDAATVDQPPRLEPVRLPALRRALCMRGHYLPSFVASFSLRATSRASSTDVMAWVATPRVTTSHAWHPAAWYQSSRCMPGGLERS